MGGRQKTTLFSESKSLGEEAKKKVVPQERGRKKSKGRKGK